MATEETSIFAKPPEDKASGSADTGQSPVYHGTLQSKTAKYSLFAFISVIVVMVAIAFIICVIQGFSNKQGFLYILLAINLLGFIFIELVVYRMINTGDLVKEKAWYLYFLGACTIVEAIIIDIVAIN